MSERRRPDDSGQLDDDTMVSIIAEGFERHTDPVTRRDGLWIISRLDAVEARVQELKGMRAEYLALRERLIDECEWFVCACGAFCHEDDDGVGCVMDLHDPDGGHEYACPQCYDDAHTCAPAYVEDGE
jgi:hypothetical protein